MQISKHKAVPVVKNEHLEENIAQRIGNTELRMLPQRIVGSSGNTFTLLGNRRLGAGTFGQVFAATDEAQATEDNVKYAVKICARYVASLKSVVSGVWQQTKRPDTGVIYERCVARHWSPLSTDRCMQRST